MAVGMTQEDIALHGGRVMDAVRDLFEALRALRIDRRVKLVLHGNDDLHRLGTAVGIAMAHGQGTGTGQWQPHEGLPFGLYDVLVTSAPRYEAEAVDRYKKNYELVRQAVEDMPVYLHPFPDGAMRWRKPVVREAGDVTMTDYQHRMAWRGKAVASDIVKEQ